MGDYESCKKCGHETYIPDKRRLLTPGIKKNLAYNLIIFEYFGNRGNSYEDVNFKYYGHHEEYKFYGKVLELSQIIAKGNTIEEVKTDAKKKILYYLNQYLKSDDKICESDTIKPIIHEPIKIEWDGNKISIDGNDDLFNWK